MSWEASVPDDRTKRTGNRKKKIMSVTAFLSLVCRLINGYRSSLHTMAVLSSLLCSHAHKNINSTSRNAPSPVPSLVAQSLLREIRRETDCSRTIVSYSIWKQYWIEGMSSREIQGSDFFGGLSFRDTNGSNSGFRDNEHPPAPPFRSATSVVSACVGLMTK